jgi:hypothetical protein
MLGIALGLVSAPVSGAERYSDYHSFAEVEAQLAAWQKAHAGVAALQTIGESAGGRAIRVLRIAAPGPVDPDQRPAVFVGANVAGHHNAGTEAALHLAGTLLEKAGGTQAELLSRVTFYVAPVLNPDAHDALFQTPRTLRSGNASRIDHDRDGLEAEDGVDDLNGDGRITSVRVPDPAGEWLPHPKQPRLMVKGDAAKGWVGAYRLESEGNDDDGDGEYNEDSATGIHIDESFPHAFPYPKPEAGPWSSFAPETKAILDFVYARRNLALALVYGPANNLLALPESLGGGGDVSSEKFKLPKFAAEMLGFDPEGEYTLDEVWEVAKDQPFVRQRNITKEMLGQFLGAGPATKLEDDDIEVLKRLAEAYKERLEKSGLDKDRPGAQYLAGGMTPWLYYQAGLLPVELDVWGIPKAKQSGADGKDQPLDLDRLEKMTPEEFLALDPKVVGAFLHEIGAPPQMTAEVVTERVRSGQTTPEKMAQMARQMGAGKAGEKGDDKANQRELEIVKWLEENDPEALVDWTPVRLSDGTAAEVGGRDPFAETTPPMPLLQPALEAHTQTALDLAGQLARVEISSLKVTGLGGDVYRVEAVAANRGRLATHTKMAQRARSRLPVRLEIDEGGGIELVTGQRSRVAERLDGQVGVVAGEWLVKARPGATVTVRVTSENAGSDVETSTIGKGGSR